MAWSNKDIWRRATLGGGITARRQGKTQIGRQNVRSARALPSPYQARYADFPLTVRTAPNGAKYPFVDAPNLRFFYRFEVTNVPFPAARNGAWEALFENIRGDTADLAVTMAQWNESLSMIANRASSLVRAARALRKGRFRKFTKELRVKPKRKHRNLSRKKVINDFSGLWLEYSFGWSPLFGDIYNACSAIQQPLPAFEYIGRGKEDFTFYETGSNTEIFFGVGRCEQGALVILENPNLYLLQQMGVANPLLVAWEVIPFSFVADWVFDISAFLGSVTDTLGLRLERTYHTFSVKKTSVTAGTDSFPNGLLTGQCSQMRRFVGLSRPMPNMRFLANIGQNWKRAANAVSLLGVLLTGRQ